MPSVWVLGTGVTLAILMALCLIVMHRLGGTEIPSLVSEMSATEDQPLWSGSVLTRATDHLLAEEQR